MSLFFVSFACSFLWNSFSLRFVFVCLVLFSLAFHFSRLAQRIFAILCAQCKHFDLFTCMIDAVASQIQTHRGKMRASRMCQRRVHSKRHTKKWRTTHNKRNHKRFVRACICMFSVTVLLSLTEAQCMKIDGQQKSMLCYKQIQLAHSIYLASSPTSHHIAFYIIFWH